MAPPQMRKRSRQELQLLALREVLDAIAASLPLHEILSAVANMAIIVADTSSAWLLLAEGGRLDVKVARGEGAERLSGALGDAGTLARYAGRVEPEVVSGRSILPGDPLLGPLAGGQPVIVLPVRSGDRFHGLMIAITTEDTPDAVFLQALADQAATAIHNAELHAESRAWRLRLDGVFGAMAESVLVFDREGRLALLNPSAQELLAGRQVQIGDRIDTVWARAGWRDALGQPLEPPQIGPARSGAERSDYLEANLPGPAGQVYLLLSAVPLLQDGQVEGMVIVARDITTIKELERQRAEFLSMVSHELRTPLTAIRGHTQLLLRGLSNGKEIRDLDHRLLVVANQTQKLNKLIGDLLDISRAGSGHFRLDLGPVDLADLLRQVIAEQALLAPTHQFACDVDGASPICQGDRERLEQVLLNLLGNAVKYSPAGSMIKAGLQVKGDQAVISVNDQGMGIGHEDMASIFMPFSRLPQPKGRHVEGVGLGLYISRAIIEAHHGRIWLQSQVGQGTTVLFSLPL